MIKQGSTFGGYTVEGVLDRNSAGLLYTGRNSDRNVIIGVLSSEDLPLIDRYVAEARSFAKLQHSSLPRILDAGVDSGRAYAIWEPPSGEDLSAIERDGRFVPFEQKLDVVIQIADALHYIHASGLVHRNVNPRNILITAGAPAALTKYEFAENRGSGRFMKPSYYSSPEQMGSREIDAGSDQFSLATVLYEWIGGRRPFGGDSLPAVLTEIISGPHKSLGDLLPGCAVELVQILDRALSKRSTGRYPSCKAFGDALQAFSETLPRHSETLRVEVERLRAEVESGEHTLAALGIAVTSEPGGGRELEVEPSDQRASDYGGLLARNADLIQRFGALADRITSSLSIFQLLREAHAQLEEREFEGCERTLRSLFQVAPDHVVGRRLLESCRDGQYSALCRKAFEDRSGLLLDQVRAALDRQQPSLSLLGAQAILEFEPAHAEAVALRDKSERMLEAGGSGRKQRVKELLDMCRSRLRAGEYDAALKVSEELFKLSPDLRDALDLRQSLSGKSGENRTPDSVE